MFIIARSKFTVKQILVELEWYTVILLSAEQCSQIDKILLLGIDIFRGMLYNMIRIHRIS